MGGGKTRGSVEWVGISLIPRPFRARAWRKGLGIRLGSKRARMAIGEGEGIARHTPQLQPLKQDYEAVICPGHCHGNRKQSIW